MTCMTAFHLHNRWYFEEWFNKLTILTFKNNTGSYWLALYGHYEHGQILCCVSQKKVLQVWVDDKILYTFKYMQCIKSNPLP